MVLLAAQVTLTPFSDFEPCLLWQYILRVSLFETIDQQSFQRMASTQPNFPSSHLQANQAHARQCL
jgi:hypothetical protein